MYNSDNIANNIKNLAKKKNILIKTLLKDVGLGFNTMANMKTSMPKADNLAKIADYLDCSVDYLLGRTDNPEINHNLSQDIRPVFIAAASGNEHKATEPDIKTIIEIENIEQKHNK